MTLTILSVDEKEVLNVLKDVIDPEIELNIVDLGLVYGIQRNSKTKGIIVSMTLTSIGCPMGDVIMDDAKSVLFNHFPDYKITVQFVWSPKWTPEMASEEGQLHFETH